MKYWLLLAFPLFLFSCKGKEKDGSDNGGHFPVVSFIKGQVRDVDTSIYNIAKVVTFNNQSDTVPLPREAFRKEAAIFLGLPDITERKYRSDYDTSNIYDETLERIVLFYTAKDPEAPIQREQVIIDPNRGSGGMVETFVIDYYPKENGAITHKVLTWQVNSFFQVTESVPGPGGTDRLRHTKVVWNDFTSASK